jgi:hypothetical protein
MGPALETAADAAGAMASIPALSGDDCRSLVDHVSARIVAPAPAANRRTHRRLSPDEVHWLRAARLKYGPQVRILDISAGGLLVETEKELKRGAKLVFELAGPDSTILMPSRVLRCDAFAVDGGVHYRGACAFARPLTLPDLLGERTLGESVASDIVAGLDALGTLAPIRKPADTVAAEASPSASSAMWQKVIVRYRDGRLLRGYTSNFHTDKPQIHVSEQPASGKTVHVPLASLKALFFVREFAGDPSYVDKNVFNGSPVGRKVEVTFHDGEVLVGSTISYRYEGTGFFVQPADPRSNNQRVFVILSAIQHVRFI